MEKKLHEKKKQSLLSWVQSAGGHGVRSFSQLRDGKLLSELVVALSDKDSNLSDKADIEPKETDSIKPFTASADDEAQQELVKETDDSSTKKIESFGQEVINGFHDSGTIELYPSGLFSHSDLSTEDGENSESRVAIESNSSELINEVQSQKAEDDDKNCVSMDSCVGVSVNGSIKMDCSDSHDDSNSVKNAGDTDFNIPADGVGQKIEGRYNVVLRFIESMLELQCDTLVSFSQCLEGDELELAKITVLLLSAMVQYSLSTKKDHIMASCYSLAADEQEEIMDCLEIFLKERQSPIVRKEFHSRLARRAKLRISPRKHASAMYTPQLKRSAKKGRKKKAYNNMEEFLDKGFESPIQNLIQSPNIRHITPNSEARLLEAVRCKDKTIASLTYDLDMEKFNADDLKKQNEDLSCQLTKLKKENKKLKKELDEVQTNLENSELAFEKAQKDWKNEVKNYQNQIKDLKEAEKFWKESYQLEDIPKKQKTECSCSEEIGSLKCALLAKDAKIQEFQKQMEILSVQLDKLSQEREDLKSQLEESLNTDNKTSCGRLSTQEKCFNISDLSLRNELKTKCDELQKNLKQMKIECSVKAEKLEELASQKDKIEKECKAKLRKSDKEREDAINSLKKLEIENSNLKGQIEVFKNILPDLSSTSLPKSPADSNSTPANRRSLRNRNVCDSEKIGQLWHNYEDETDDALNSTTKTGFELDKPESSMDVPPESEKSHNRLHRSQSANNVASDGDALKVSSQNDFSEVPPLIQNICKIVREDNILVTNVLLELHKYERDFDMNDLVRVLTLLTRILLKEDGTCGRNFSKHKKSLSSHDLNRVVDLESETEESEPEQPHRKSISSNAVSKKSNKHRGLDAGSSKSLKQRYSIEVCQQLLEEERKKVTCLQAKLKNYKDLLNLESAKVKQLKLDVVSAVQLRDTNVERCRSLAYEYELISNELNAIKLKMLKEQSAPRVQDVTKPPPPCGTEPPPPSSPSPCDKCPKLKEIISDLERAKRDGVKLRDRLNNDLESRKIDIEDLKRELCKLSSKNKELEEKLCDPKIIGAGVFSPKLKSLCEIFRESLYKDVDSVDNGCQDIPCEVSTVDVSTVTNAEPEPEPEPEPSTSGFVNNNRNQTQLRAFCKAEDEAEMLSQSSIFELQSDSPNQRLKEINRRNTLCLPHLKSQYPLEMNTTPSQHKYFQPPAIPSCSKDMPASESIHLAKKRKISNASSVRASLASLMSNSKPSTSGIRIQHSSTPKMKTFISRKSNTGAAKLHFHRRPKNSTEK